MLADRFDPRYFERDVLFRYHAGWAHGGQFTRPSPATYVDRTGTLQEVGPHVPRIEWLDQDGDGVRETPTLLLEPSCTNLLPWSEALDNATWDKIGSTVSPNATTAPDGQATADRLTEDTSTGQHLIRRSVSVTAGHQAFSIYLRDDGRRYASLYPQGAAVGWAIFDLQSGTVTRTGGANLVRAYIADAIQTASGVWYRCVVVVDVAEPGALMPHVYLTNSATNAASHYTGGGTLGVYAWGAQLEASSVATSYVPTTASTASRAADALTFPWTHAPGSCAVLEAGIEAGLRDQTGANRAWQIGAGTLLSARAFQAWRHSSTETYRVAVGSGSAETVSAAPLIPLGAEYQRLALLDVRGSEARVRLLQRYRETPGSGPWIDASGSWSAWLDVSGLLALGWQAKYLTIGNVREGFYAGRLKLSDLLVLDGREISVSALTWDHVRRLLPW